MELLITVVSSEARPTDNEPHKTAPERCNLTEKLTLITFIKTNQNETTNFTEADTDSMPIGQHECICLRL